MTPTASVGWAFVAGLLLGWLLPRMVRAYAVARDVQAAGRLDLHLERRQMWIREGV